MASFALSNFENENSGTFISEIMVNGYGLIKLAIDKILDSENAASLTDCEEALIAAEMIAAAAGNPAHDFPEEAMEWLTMNAPPGSLELQELVAHCEPAADAIDRIVADSELREFWDDHPEFNEWFEAQVDLQERLLP